MKNPPTPKIVADPIRGLIDIRPVLPIIETPEFQALAYKCQLSTNYLIFPSATHTRRAHCLGAYDATKELTNRWANELKLINEKEAWALCIFALTHDIGHYPLSHLSEPLFPVSHNERNIKIIDKLKKEIEACGADFKLVRSMFTHENPLHLAVRDKNLGTEKFDYLQRDGMFTLGYIPEVKYLQRHIYWIDNKLVIDEKVVDNAKEIQEFYQRMNRRVYLRKASLITQRLIQKLIFLMLDSGLTTLDELENFTDFELLTMLRNAKNKTVGSLFDNILKRNLFKEAIVIKDERYIEGPEDPNKSLRIFGISKKELDRLTEKFSPKHQAFLLKTEEEIAKRIGIEKSQILIVPPVSTERFKEQDINILTRSGRIDSLKKRYPHHFKAMSEDTAAYMTLRVCALEKFREKLMRNGGKIKNFILGLES